MLQQGIPRWFWNLTISEYHAEFQIIESIHKWFVPALSEFLTQNQTNIDWEQEIYLIQEKQASNVCHLDRLEERNASPCTMEGTLSRPQWLSSLQVPDLSQTKLQLAFYNYSRGLRLRFS